MKNFDIDQWFSLRRFPAGRRAYTVRQLKKAADKLGLASISALSDKVIADDLDLLALLQQWRNEQNVPVSTWSKDVLALDLTVDRLVAQLRDLLAALAAAFTGSERGKAAQTLLDGYFQNGVVYYTQCVVEEEVERVGVLLKGLRAQSREAEAALVGDLVAELDARHKEYAALVEAAVRPTRVAFETLRASDIDNQRAFLELLTAVFHETRAATDPKAQRAELLRVVAEQDHDILQAIKAKRKAKDVDPDSGEPVTDDPSPVPS